MSVHQRYLSPAPALQVSTSTSTHEFDPNEPTARPGNAHVHAHFHSQIVASVGPSNDQQLSTSQSRPLNPIEQERLSYLDRLKYFLATAPSRWDSGAPDSNQDATSTYHGMVMPIEPTYQHHPPSHPCLNRFMLPNQEFVSCVLWNGLYHITGTDIVRALVFRFEVHLSLSPTSDQVSDAYASIGFWTTSAEHEKV